MIYLAVFGALICAFLGGFCAQWLVLRYRQEDRCQPALDQLAAQNRKNLKQDIADFNALTAGVLPKKEIRKPLRRQWSEDMPAKDAQ